MTTETAIWMVDCQSESDLDSIRNSCDVLKKKSALKKARKSENLNVAKITPISDSLLTSGAQLKIAKLL